MELLRVRPEFIEQSYYYADVPLKAGSYDSQEMFDRVRGLSWRARGNTSEEVAIIAHEVILNSKNITPEFFLTQDRDSLHGLDPSFLTIVRAVIGPEIYTKEVLDLIRYWGDDYNKRGHVWCTGDLPETLFESLSIKDDNRYLEYMKSYFGYNGGQTKTRLLVQSGALDSLVNIRRQKSK